jgi:hypothetical protein
MVSVNRDRRLPFSRTGIIGELMGHGMTQNGAPMRGMVTWSALLLIAVVGPHTFNSGHAYLLDPRRRFCRSELLRFMQAPFSCLESPRYFSFNIHSAVFRLTGPRERRVQIGGEPA